MVAAHLAAALPLGCAPAPAPVVRAPSPPPEAPPAPPRQVDDFYDPYGLGPLVPLPHPADSLPVLAQKRRMVAFEGGLLHMLEPQLSYCPLRKGGKHACTLFWVAPRRAEATSPWYEPLASDLGSWEGPFEVQAALWAYAWPVDGGVRLGRVDDKGVFFSATLRGQVVAEGAALPGVDASW